MSNRKKQYLSIDLNLFMNGNEFDLAFVRMAKFLVMHIKSFNKFDIFCFIEQFLLLELLFLDFTQITNFIYMIFDDGLTKYDGERRSFFVLIF